jgi:OOP family OmpA-OmpF porin
MTRALFAVLLLALAMPVAAQPYLWGGMANSEAAMRLSPDPSGKDFGAFELGAGYQFNRYLGAEVGYLNLPSYDSVGGPVNAFWSAKGYTAAATASFPLSSRWSLLGKAGVASLKSEFKTVTVPAGAVTITKSDLGSRPLVGFGVQFLADEHLALRAMYQRIQGKDESELDNVSMLGLSIAILF